MRLGLRHLLDLSFASFVLVIGGLKLGHLVVILSRLIKRFIASAKVSAYLFLALFLAAFGTSTSSSRRRIKATKLREINIA